MNAESDIQALPASTATDGQALKLCEQYAGEQEPSADASVSPPYEVEINIIPEWREEIVGRGVSGYVERLDRGTVRKFPLLGLDHNDSARDLDIEYRVYRYLQTYAAAHPRLVGFISYDPILGIELEYIKNGNLKDYMRHAQGAVSAEQRLEWAIQASEGMALLHRLDIVHGDVKPANLLVDDNLELRIADFAGSSLLGSKSFVSESTRFCLPRDWHQPPTKRSDIFALGSTLYFIITGAEPYEEVASGEVESFFSAGTFPDTDNVIAGDLIRDCWLGRVRVAEDVVSLLLSAEEPGAWGTSSGKLGGRKG